MAGKLMSKAFKTHEERFAGFIIKVVLVNTDEDGYGRAERWEVFADPKSTDKVLYSAKTLTLARLWAKRANKDESFRKAVMGKATPKKPAQVKVRSIRAKEEEVAEDESGSQKFLRRMREQRDAEETTIIPIETAEANG